MNHRLAYGLAGLLLLAAVIMGVVFQLTSSVDASGMLHEPFFLVPLMYLAVLGSVAAGVAGLVLRRRRPVAA